MNNENPFKVPAFSHAPLEEPIKYVWWSWHPLYPFWASSCWRYDNPEEAMEVFTNPRSSSIENYHNKLIKHDGNTREEVLDIPCERLDVWRKIKIKMDNGDYDKQ
tara:strand:+ start:299 stop:613 length:315 start_codon:yes stop_codon:yes gene_type:complete